MQATSFPAPGRPDKNFTIAIALVALLGAAELIAVGLHYGGRRRAARQATQPVAVATPTTAPVATPAAAPQTMPSAAPVLAQPSPSNAALSAAENLLKEATLLRERGDTNNALARLQDASQRDPKNANVLAEMAMIYESMQLLDRSNETWRKIQEIGPSAGALYELADMKLKLGAAPAAAITAGPGFAGVSPLDAGTNRNDPEGIPSGSTFGISEATLTENPDPEADTNLTLRVGVKSRASTILDHTKVKIQVYFYDTVDNNKVALTDAEVNYEWLTPNHDWKGTNPEILAVGYVRLKNGAALSEAALTEAASAVTPPSGGKKARAPKKPEADAATRKYAGYQVRVYYNDQLQDVRAEPTKLLNLFPAAHTLHAVMQLLIVHHDAEVGEQLVRMVTEYTEHHCGFAASDRGALDWARGVPRCSLLITQLQGDGVNGLSLGATLSDTFPGLQTMFLPDYPASEQRLEIPRTKVFPEPIDGERLLHAIERAEAQRQTGVDAFHALDVLQMCCLSHRSGAIQFVMGSKVAIVFLLNGRIVHAERAAARGADALYEIVPWEAAEFAYDYSVRAPAETIHLAWDEAVIAAVARRKTPVVGEVTPTAPPSPAGGGAKPNRWGIFGGPRKVVL